MPESLNYDYEFNKMLKNVGNKTPTEESFSLDDCMGRLVRLQSLYRMINDLLQSSKHELEYVYSEMPLDGLLAFLEDKKRFGQLIPVDPKLISELRWALENLPVARGNMTIGVFLDFLNIEEGLLKDRIERLLK